ncbi:MAG: MerR family transcriptional regulator [Pseudomonadota bacterium]
MNKTDITYSIGAVSRMTGIEKHKLRNWCDRYLTHIQKIEIGNTQHRRFTEADISLIKKIKEYRRKGYMLNVAVENARQDLIEVKN